jgi:hypothetical protein
LIVIFQELDNSNGFVAEQPFSSVTADADFYEMATTFGPPPEGDLAARLRLPDPCCVIIHSTKILLLELGIVTQYLFFTHARREPAKHVPHGDSQAADTRLAGPFPRLNRDPFLVHAFTP